MLKLAGGMAAGATALLVTSSMLKKSLKEAARRDASSPSEYHLALWCPELELRWHLVKLAKGASMRELYQAASDSYYHLNLEEFSFYHANGAHQGAFRDVSSLEMLLAALPADALQVAQLILARDTPRAAVPALKAFQMCGLCWPFYGNSYQFDGPQPIPEYNFSEKVFPATGHYPYGATVRFRGQKQQVGEFGKLR